MTIGAIVALFGIGYLWMMFVVTICCKSIDNDLECCKKKQKEDETLSTVLARMLFTATLGFLIPFLAIWHFRITRYIAILVFFAFMTTCLYIDITDFYLMLQ